MSIDQAEHHVCPFVTYQQKFESAVQFFFSGIYCILLEVDSDYQNTVTIPYSLTHIPWSSGATAPGLSASAGIASPGGTGCDP